KSPAGLRTRPRTFRIRAARMVPVLRWMEGNREQAAPPAAPARVEAGVADVPAAIPSAPASAPAGVPAAPSVPPAPGAQADTAAAPASGVVQVETDVLRLLVDGGSVLRAELLADPQTRDEGSPPAVLFDDSAAPL